MDIRSTVADLLTLHDCVIIPGFGGFIGNFVPARIDHPNHTFYPPSKSLLFNRNLVKNDGLLAHAIAAGQGISYADSCRAIEEFAAGCREQLTSGRALIFPGIGELHPAEEGTLRFEQETASNLFAGAFGLTPVVTPPVSVTLSVLPGQAKGSSAMRPGSKLPGILRRAAILALPLGIAALVGLTQFDRMTQNHGDAAGILESVISGFSSSSLSGKKEAIVVASPAPARPATTIKTPPATRQVSPETTTAKTVAPDGEANRFAIIVGAFRIEENARKLAGNLRESGHEARIFDRSATGLYRVAIGACDDRGEALALLNATRSSAFPGAWLLVK